MQTKGGRGSKNPKILRTSFMYGPLGRSFCRIIPPNIRPSRISDGDRNDLSTPLEKRTQVWFELQEEISLIHEYLMKMLPKNVRIKKIFRGTLPLVYIYSQNLFSLINKIFQQNFKWQSVLTPIRWICWKITKNSIFDHILVKHDLESKHQKCRSLYRFF